MPLDMQAILADLRRDEGEVKAGDRHVVYDDATGEPIVAGTHVRGNPTVAYGRNLTAGRGITDPEADELLEDDVNAVCRELDNAIAWWRGLSDNRQRALVNMAFNMGVPTLMQFRKMLGALQAGRYEVAAEEALRSRWSSQVGARAERISDLIFDG